MGKLKALLATNEEKPGKKYKRVKETSQKKSKERPSAEGMTQLEAFEQIIDIAKDCRMEDKYLQEMHPYLKVVAAKQDITHNQAMLLALVCNFSAYGNYADMGDLCRHIDAKIVSLLKYKPDFDVLV